MDYDQKFYIANKALGEALLHADKAQAHLNMVKTILENDDKQLEHLALSEEKPPHGGNRESGRDK